MGRCMPTTSQGVRHLSIPSRCCSSHCKQAEEAAYAVGADESYLHVLDCTCGLKDVMALVGVINATKLN